GSTRESLASLRFPAGASPACRRHGCGRVRRLAREGAYDLALRIGSLQLIRRLHVIALVGLYRAHDDGKASDLLPHPATAGSKIWQYRFSFTGLACSDILG